MSVEQIVQTEERRKESMRRTGLISAILMVLMATAVVSVAAQPPTTGTFELKATGVGRLHDTVEGLALVKLDVGGDFWATFDANGELDTFIIHITSGTLTIYCYPGGVIGPIDATCFWLSWDNANDPVDELSGTRCWKIKHKDTDYTLRLKITWNYDYSKGRMCGYISGRLEYASNEYIDLVGFIRGRAYPV